MCQAPIKVGAGSIELFKIDLRDNERPSIVYIIHDGWVQKGAKHNACASVKWGFLVCQKLSIASVDVLGCRGQPQVTNDLCVVKKNLHRAKGMQE